MVSAIPTLIQSSVLSPLRFLSGITATGPWTGVAASQREARAAITPGSYFEAPTWAHE